MKRALNPINFVIGIMITFSIFVFGSIGMISKITPAVTAFNNCYKYNNISVLLILGASFAYSSSFALDLQTRYVFLYLSRIPKKVYLLSKCISVALAGGMTLTCGASIFIIIICITQPCILPDAQSFSNQAFSDLIIHGDALLFFLAYLYIIFISGAFFSSLGLCISSFWPNRYVANVTPFVLGFALNQIANVLHLPIWLDPVKLSTARVIGVSTPVILCMVTITFTCLTIICDVVFIRSGRRRITNG